MSLVSCKNCGEQLEASDAKREADGLVHYICFFTCTKCGSRRKTSEVELRGSHLYCKNNCKTLCHDCKEPINFDDEVIDYNTPMETHMRCKTYSCRVCGKTGGYKDVRHELNGTYIHKTCVLVCPICGEEVLSGHYKSNGITYHLLCALSCTRCGENIINPTNHKCKLQCNRCYKYAELTDGCCDLCRKKTDMRICRVCEVKLPYGTPFHVINGFNYCTECKPVVRLATGLESKLTAETVEHWMACRSDNKYLPTFPGDTKIDMTDTYKACINLLNMKLDAKTKALNLLSDTHNKLIICKDEYQLLFKSHKDALDHRNLEYDHLQNAYNNLHDAKERTEHKVSFLKTLISENTNILLFKLIIVVSLFTICYFMFRAFML